MYLVHPRVFTSILYPFASANAQLLLLYNLFSSLSGPGTNSWPLSKHMLILYFLCHFFPPYFLKRTSMLEPIWCLGPGYTSGSWPVYGLAHWSGAHPGSVSYDHDRGGEMGCTESHEKQYGQVSQEEVKVGEVPLEETMGGEDI